MLKTDTQKLVLDDSSKSSELRTFILAKGMAVPIHSGIVDVVTNSTGAGHKVAVLLAVETWLRAEFGGSCLF